MEMGSRLSKRRSTNLHRPPLCPAEPRRRGSGIHWWWRQTRRALNTGTLFLLAIWGCASDQASLESLYRSASLARQQGRYKTGAEQADEGLRRSRGQPGWLWRFGLLKAEIFRGENLPEKSRAELDKLRGRGYTAPEFRARFLLDEAFLCSGQKARNYLLKAQTIARASGLVELRPAIEIRLAQVIAGSNFDEADRLLTRARRLAENHHDLFHAAAALNSQGYIRLGSRCSEAIPLLDQAWRIARSIGARPLLGTVQGNRGWCYFVMGNSERALPLLTEAAAVAAEIGETDKLHVWQGDIGNVYFEAGDLDRALAFFRSAARTAEQARDDSWRVNWLNNIARVYLEKKDFAAAETFLREAVRLQRRYQNHDWDTYVLLNTAAIADSKGRFLEAERGYRELIRLAARKEPNLVWQGHAGLAWLYDRKHDRAAAEREYRSAIAAADGQWAQISQTGFKVTFLDRLIRFHQDYVEFLALGGEKEKALEASENARARVLSGRWKGRIAPSLQFSSADALKLAREMNTVLLSYWLAPDHSWLWAISAKGIFQYSLPAEKDIRKDAERYTLDLSKSLKDPLVTGSVVAQRLYRQLVGPAETLIPSGSRVIIVPDGCLHDLNFETLIPDTGRPRYWIEDAIIAVAPSLGLLRSGTGIHSRPRLLVIGAPSVADGSVPPLPHLQQEIDLIVSAFPDHAIYTREQATPDSYRRAARAPFDFIHIAAHVRADPDNPLNSAVILSGSELQARDVLDIRLRCELVTLSACQSAGGRAYSGEGLMGFAWALMKTGARNVIGALWNVDDWATPRLMQQLYGQLRKGVPPAQALRGAKLEILHAGGRRARPYYWAEFQVFTRFIEPRAAAVRSRPDGSRGPVVK